MRQLVRRQELFLEQIQLSKSQFVHTLELKAIPGTWRLYMTRKADPAFRAFSEKVWDRDNYTCQFCSFQAHEYQEVVNLDHNYNNNKLSNMVTACVFCTQCLFLESVGSGDYGGGTLIYMPEMSQADLHSFCHVVFCAITNDTGYKATAQSVYRSFKFRSQLVEDKFGEGMSNPNVMGQMIIEAGLEDQNVAENVLKDIRLLPSRAKFRKQIEKWAASALQELSD